MTDRAARVWQTSYRAALVVPISGPPIPDGAVLVDGERIAWVGPCAEQPAAHDARVVELGDAVLTPGLVNAHAHLDLTALRGTLDGLPFFEWIRAVVAARTELDEWEWLDSARLGAVEALEAGVTTVGDTSPSTASFDAMTELGLRGIAYLEVLGPDPAQASAAMGDLRGRLDAAKPRAAARVQLGVSPHAPYSVSDALYSAAVAHAREERLPLATHVAESADESRLVSEGTGPFADLLRSRGIAVARRAASPVQLLERLGVIGPDTLLIHCVRCDRADVAAIERGAAAIACCPHSNAYFGHGAAPANDFMRAGVRVGVGSDSLASNDRMDPIREARAALSRAADGRPEAAWMLATLGGARALGLDRVVGTLEAGKQADLAAFPLDAAARHEVPEHAGPAILTVVGGVERVRNGRVTADADALRARVETVSGRLREWRAARTRA